MRLQAVPLAASARGGRLPHVVGEHGLVPIGADRDDLDGPPDDFAQPLQILAGVGRQIGQVSHGRYFLRQPGSVS